MSQPQCTREMSGELSQLSKPEPALSSGQFKQNIWEVQPRMLVFFYISPEDSDVQSGLRTTALQLSRTRMSPRFFEMPLQVRVQWRIWRVFPSDLLCGPCTLSQHLGLRGPGSRSRSGQRPCQPTLYPKDLVQKGVPLLIGIATNTVYLPCAVLTPLIFIATL